MSSYHRRFFFVILVIIFLLIAAFSINAQEGRIYHQPCPYSDGTYYQGDVFPRYEYRNQRLVLISWDTGEVVQEIETGLITAQFNFLNWSPDCRYISAWIDSPDTEYNDTVIWDLITNTRATTFEDQVGRRGYAQIDWSPASDRVIIQTRNGAFLRFPGTNSQQMIFDAVRNDRFYGDTRRFENFLWDEVRRELIAYAVNNDVVVFNMDTGEIIAYLYDPSRTGNGDIHLTDDGLYLVHRNRFSGYDALYDRNTYTIAECRSFGREIDCSLWLRYEEPLRFSDT